MSKKDLISQAEIRKFYKDKKILIIGGTGTVGTGMVDMLLKHDPKVIRILSRDEYKQYLLANKYEGERRLRYLLGDVRDLERIERAAADIDIIFNLAALKHVPACEYNPFEAVKTNVIGTQNVISAAINKGVKNVVFTSSDKAISPTNAMGATKLLAERLMIAGDNMKGSADITFSAVRFGNVLGSRGSVAPLFLEQIKTEKRITVTDPEMTRFMMSITDAISFTLNAAAISKGGEIFVLKMPNIRMRDFAEAVIELACEKYGMNASEITIEEIGLRRGEKMYEELMTTLEIKNAYELPNMYAIVPDFYKHKEVYDDVPRARITSYASSETAPISKEEVRELLIRDNVI